MIDTSMLPKSDHEHVFRLILGPDGHGLVFGRYEGYAHRCECGEPRPDYRRFLESFHDCPDCGAQHRRPPA